MKAAGIALSAVLVMALACTSACGASARGAASSSGAAIQSARSQAQPAGVTQSATLQAQALSATTTKVKIGTKKFKLKLAGNKGAQAFRAYLSKARTFAMKELNGNEKYHYFPKRTFPTASKRYTKVKAGDVMLYGDDCLVIFYKTHTTSYSYTKIGRLTSAAGLKKAAGKKSVQVKFFAMAQAASAQAAGGDSGATGNAAQEADAIGGDAGGEAAASESSDAAQAGSAATQVYLTVNGQRLSATLADNSSARALVEALAEGSVAVDAHDYGGFEKVGALGFSLPRNDETITTKPGDLILYQGTNLCVYYAQNTYSFTRLGAIDNIDAAQLKELLGDGDVQVGLSLT